MEEREDLYRILEVAPDADAQSIDEAYWRLVVRYQSSGRGDVRGGGRFRGRFNDGPGHQGLRSPVRPPKTGRV